MRTLPGLFLPMKFSKPPFTEEQHIKILQDRGLIIQDLERLKYYLKNIGYYRLTGYMYPFQQNDGSHKFKKDTTFELILNHYEFDKKLKFLLIDMIERVEISIRAYLCNSMALSYGSHWYLNESLFINRHHHSDLIKYISDYYNDCKELFLKEYKNKYTEPILPPSWMIMETLTFGKLSSLYENLMDCEEKREVATTLNVVVPILESWLKSLNFIRNCCAHHSRLWNRKIPIKPTIPVRKEKRFLNTVNEYTNLRVYGILSCLLHLLNSINPSSNFKQKLKDLFNEYPMVNIENMGFYGEWDKEPLWV